MKFSINNYFHPTPKKIRVFGDSILAAGTLVTGGGLIAFDTLEKIYSPHELKIIIGASFILAVCGKFLSNFFKEDEQK
jgi:uncharacterized PurR-regulated membrane protein YhhQ (DUF165 family)